MGLRLEGFASLDGSGWEAGLNRLKHSTQGFSSNVKSMIMTGVGIFTVQQAIQKTVETAEQLVKSGQRMNATVEEIQILKKAANDGAKSIEDIAAAFEKVNKARAKALGGGPGTDKMLSAFSKLGVSEEDLRTKRSAELFMGPISQAAQKMNPDELAAVFSQAGLKGFGELIPVLKQDFGDLADEMKGRMMSAETAVALKNFNEQLELIGITITSMLAPKLVQFGNALLDMLSKFKVASEFWKEFNKQSGGEGTTAGGIGDWLLAQAQNIGDEAKIKVGAAADFGSWLVGQAADVGAFGVGNKEERAAISDKATKVTRGVISKVFPGISEGAVEEAQSRMADVAGRENAAVAAMERADYNERFRRFKERQKIKEMASEIGVASAFNADVLGDSEDKAEKQRGVRPIKDTSDSLVKVGNFLGSSSGIMQRVAEEHLQVARMTLEEVRKWNNDGGRILERRESWNDGGMIRNASAIGIPTA